MVSGWCPDRLINKRKSILIIQFNLSIFQNLPPFQHRLRLVTISDTFMMLINTLLCTICHHSHVKNKHQRQRQAQWALFYLNDISLCTDKIRNSSYVIQQCAHWEQTASLWTASVPFFCSVRLYVCMYEIKNFKWWGVDCGVFRAYHLKQYTFYVLFYFSTIYKPEKNSNFVQGKCVFDFAACCWLMVRARKDIGKRNFVNKTLWA